MSVDQRHVTWGLVALVVLLAATTSFYVLGGARTPAPAAFKNVPGDPDQGRLALMRLGCNACHDVPGVRHTGGRGGPALDDLRSQRTIAGRLPNTPENVVRFILDPQGVAPGTAMPDLGVVDVEAEHIVAYLYTLGGR